MRVHAQEGWGRGGVGQAEWPQGAFRPPPHPNPHHSATRIPSHTPAETVNNMSQQVHSEGRPSEQGPPNFGAGYSKLQPPVEQQLRNNSEESAHSTRRVPSLPCSAGDGRDDQPLSPQCTAHESFLWSAAPKSGGGRGEGGGAVAAVRAHSWPATTPRPLLPHRTISRLHSHLGHTIKQLYGYAA
jgi:hypothetical protein